MSTLSALWPVTQQFQNKNGSNLVSGKVYVYYQGRTALATTYHDEDGTVVNANPVLLDNNGRATVFADTAHSYTIIVCDYYGKELFSQDITLHDAISTAKDIVILGSDGSVKVDTTTLPNDVQYDLLVNTDIIATKKSVDNVKTDLNNLTGKVDTHTAQIESIESSLANKKDKQNVLTFNGSSTKTIKSITQNPNGEMNVEFEDIDFGQRVWINLNVVPYDSSINLLIINAAYNNGLLFFNGTVAKKNNAKFNTSAVNKLFYVNGVNLALDFRHYYGSAALDSVDLLFPCAMGGLKDTNLFYIYPTKESNIFYFNAVAPVVLV